MHWMLLSEAISRCENASVDAHNIPASELDTAIRIHAPDVLILGAPDTLGRPELLDELMNTAGPMRRIIALLDGPSLIQLREWRVATETLRDVSLNSLCAAIEGRS